MGIGKSCRSFLKRLILHAGGYQSKEAYKNVNLCDGLKVDIYGVHTHSDGAGVAGEGRDWRGVKDMTEAVGVEYRREGGEDNSS